MLDELKKTSPAVVDELIPNPLKLAEVQQVLQMLLREEVPIRQLSQVLETLGDYAGKTKDLVFLAEYVRHRLARTICTRYRDAEGRLFVLTLDPALEDKFAAGIEHSERGLFIRTAPQTIEKLCEKIGDEAAKAHPHRQAAHRARQPAGSRGPEANDRRQPAAADRHELQRNHAGHEGRDCRNCERSVRSQSSGFGVQQCNCNLNPEPETLNPPCNFTPTEPAHSPKP